MHLPIKQSDSMTDLAIKCRDLTDLLLEHLPPCADSLDVNESENIFYNQPGTRLFRIIEAKFLIAYGANLSRRWKKAI